jgi:hypothetical protein
VENVHNFPLGLKVLTVQFKYVVESRHGCSFVVSQSVFLYWPHDRQLIYRDTVVDVNSVFLNFLMVYFCVSRSYVSFN